MFKKLSPGRVGKIVLDCAEYLMASNKLPSFKGPVPPLKRSLMSLWKVLPRDPSPSRYVRTFRPREVDEVAEGSRVSLTSG